MPETREQMVRRVLFHLERTPLARVDTGTVCTSGRVIELSGAPLFALDGYTPCAALRLQVWADAAMPGTHLRTSWSSAVGEWIPALDLCRVEDFEIGEEAAVARVDAAGADVALRLHHQYFLAHPFDAGPHARSPMIGRLTSLGARWPEQRIYQVMIRESLLLAGDIVVVCGVAEREVVPGEQTGYRSTPRTRPRIRADVSMPLAICNDSSVRRPSRWAVTPHRA